MHMTRAQVSQPPLVLLRLSAEVIAQLSPNGWFAEWISELGRHVGATIYGSGGLDAAVVEALAKASDAAPDETSPLRQAAAALLGGKAAAESFKGGGGGGGAGGAGGGGGGAGGKAGKAAASKGHGKPREPKRTARGNPESGSSPTPVRRPESSSPTPGTRPNTPAASKSQPGNASTPAASKSPPGNNSTPAASKSPPEDGSTAAASKTPKKQGSHAASPQGKSARQHSASTGKAGGKRAPGKKGGHA